jgi:hypothetical protein
MMKIKPMNAALPAGRKIDQIVFLHPRSAVGICGL